MLDAAVPKIIPDCQVTEIIKMKCPSQRYPLRDSFKSLYRKEMVETVSSPFLFIFFFTIIAYNSV